MSFCTIMPALFYLRRLSPLSLSPSTLLPSKRDLEIKVFLEELVGIFDSMGRNLNLLLTRTRIHLSPDYYL